MFITSFSALVLLRLCSRYKEVRHLKTRPGSPTSVSDLCIHDYESATRCDSAFKDNKVSNFTDGVRLKGGILQMNTWSSEFLNPYDLDVLRHLYSFHNSALELALISLPSILSLCLCPLTLQSRDEISEFFWPNTTQPAVNEAVACFLAPSGMVYAVSFGFAFQQVLDKLNGIKANLNQELNEIEELIILIQRMKSLPASRRLNILLMIKKEIICIIKYLTKMKGYQDLRDAHQGK